MDNSNITGTRAIECGLNSPGQPLQQSSSIMIGDTGSISDSKIVGTEIHYNMMSDNTEAQGKYAADILDILKNFGLEALSYHSEKVARLSETYDLDPFVSSEIQQRMRDQVIKYFNSPSLGLSFDGGLNVEENLRIDDVIDRLNNPPNFATYPAIDFDKDRKWRNVWHISDIINHPNLLLRCASNGQAFPVERKFVCPECGRLFKNRPEVISTTGLCFACSKKGGQDTDTQDALTSRKRMAAVLGNFNATDWIFLKAGLFEMGSDEGEKHRQSDELRHHVKIEEPFTILSTPVTVRLYNDIMGENTREGDADFPVTGISWLESVDFCNRMSKHLGLKPCYDIQGAKVKWKRYIPGIRLLTEAEWEYACRAGSSNHLPSGNFDILDEYACYGKETLTKVAQFKPNAWALYDMLGLVCEWVWDEYRDYPTDQKNNPTVISRRMDKVHRGGCFTSAARECRCASRNFADSNTDDPMIGFRLAVSNPTGK